MLLFQLFIPGDNNVFAAEEDFFSYERFFLNQSLVDSIEKDGMMRMELKKFASNYTRGIYSLSSGEYEKAEKYLKEARSTWPEYFGTDFLLALVYEGYGDYGTAARYYKSYLRKLKALHKGNYRISQPLIISLTLSGVESYGTARDLIRHRLALYNIDLARVRPIITLPYFIFPSLGVGLIIVIYMAVRYKISPYLRKLERIKNPPEGFWVCPHCGSDNPIPVKECEECRRPRPDSK